MRNISSNFDGHGTGNACGRRALSARKVASDTATLDDRAKTLPKLATIDSFEKYFHRIRSCQSETTLSPLDCAAAIAEKCYRRSYFAAFLRLLAAGRYGSTCDLIPLLRWGSPPMRVNVAPKAALEHVRGNPALDNALQDRLEAALAAHLQPAAGCPGHYIMVKHSVSPGPIDASEKKSIPMLVRAGWSHRELFPITRPTNGERGKAITDTELPLENPRARRPRRRRFWVLEVFFLDDLGSNYCEKGRLNQNVPEDSSTSGDPFRTARGKSFSPDSIWDSVLRAATDSDTADSDCAEAEDGAAFQRRAPQAHRHALRDLFRTIRLAAASLLLARPAVLAAAGLLESSSGTYGRKMENLPIILRALRHPKAEFECSSSFVEVPLRFAPGIDLDIGLTELEVHLESRPTLRMRRIAETSPGRGSGRPSRILLSYAWLHLGPSQDSLKTSNAESDRRPCWLLAEVRDGCCRAAVYRTSDCGPTLEWVSGELTKACHDASRTLLLRAMHASRRLDLLLAPSSPESGNPAAGASVHENIHAQSTTVHESELASSVDTPAEPDVSPWACPEVYEICLQVVGFGSLLCM